MKMRDRRGMPGFPKEPPQQWPRCTTPQGDWPYLWRDATYVKVRTNGRIVSVAVIVAVAVNSDGRRQVLGMAIGASRRFGRTFCARSPGAACAGSSW
jgi:Transposase, Mutator family